MVIGRSLLSKGIELDSMGKYQEAIKFYNKFLDLNLDYVDAWNNKGLVLTKMKNYVEALECFDKALELNPDFEPAKEAKKLAIFADQNSCQ